MKLLTVTHEDNWKQVIFGIIYKIYIYISS